MRLKLKIKAHLRTHGVIVLGKGVYSPYGRLASLVQVESLAARQAIEQLYALLDATTAMAHFVLEPQRHDEDSYTYSRTLDSDATRASVAIISRRSRLQKAKRMPSPYPR